MPAAGVCLRARACVCLAPERAHSVHARCGTSCDAEAESQEGEEEEHGEDDEEEDADPIDWASE